MSLASGKICANGYQITNAFLHPQKTSQAFQLSEKQLQCFLNPSRPGNAAKSNGAETLLTLLLFAQEPTAHTELTFIHVANPPLRIYKNEYDQPPVSHYPRHRNCVRTRSQDGGTRISTREALEIAKRKGWLDEGRSHQLGSLKVSMSTEETTLCLRTINPQRTRRVCNEGIYESCLHN